MKASLCPKTLSIETGELTYLALTSVPITLICDEHPIAFSVLIAHTEGDAVTETAFAYDVSRDQTICDQIIFQLWERGTRPNELIDTLSEIL